VVALVGAQLMESKESSARPSLAVRVALPTQVLQLGTSVRLQVAVNDGQVDYGACQSTTKSGHRCTSFVNVSMSMTFTAHIVAKSKAYSMKRGESMQGTAPSKFNPVNVSDVVLASTLQRTKTFSVPTVAGPRTMVTLEQVRAHRTTTVKPLPRTSMSSSTVPKAEVHDVPTYKKASTLGTLDGKEGLLDLLKVHLPPRLVSMGRWPHRAVATSFTRWARAAWRRTRRTSTRHSRTNNSIMHDS